MSNETENETATETTTAESFGTKLKAAGKMAETQQKQRREKAVKGAHLLGELHNRVNARKLNVVEQSGFFKVSGTNGETKHRLIYIAKKGGRVSISNFVLDDPAIIQVSEEEAKVKHLGKVRGHFNFELSDDQVLAAFDRALDELSAEQVIENVEPVVTIAEPSTEVTVDA